MKNNTLAVLPRNTLMAVLIAAVIFSCRVQSGEENSFGSNGMTTLWTADVSPGNVLPEYPRPQMARREWLNLNGLWDYAITPLEIETISEYQGKIFVSFPVESELSGVQKMVLPTQKLWYKRRFEIPKDWGKKRIILNFGAVDWKTDVWINGAFMGTHKGGYDSFSFDITGALKSGSMQEIIVSVWDPTDEGYQPHGKQSLNPRGFWYTAVTGIWQTVWIEPVAQEHIYKLKLIPDIDNSCVQLTVSSTGKIENQSFAASIKHDGILIDEFKFNGGKSIVRKISNPELWTPDNPFTRR